MLDMHGSFYGDGYLGAARSTGRVSPERRKGPEGTPTIQIQYRTAN